MFSVMPVFAAGPNFIHSFIAVYVTGVMRPVPNSRKCETIMCLEVYYLQIIDLWCIIFSANVH